MLKVCVYSVNLGEYDKTKKIHVAQSYPCDFIYYEVNEENLNPDGPIPMQAKAYRVFPNKCSKLAGYDLAIYIDGNVEIIHPDFIRSIVQSDILDYNIGFSLHPWRDCAYDEIVAHTDTKYNQEIMKCYFFKFEKEGLPRHSGLYWNGFIVHNMQNYAEHLMTMYWETMLEFPAAFPPCQPVLSYVLWKTGMVPKVFPIQYGTNNWMRIHKHKG